MKNTWLVLGLVLLVFTVIMMALFNVVGGIVIGIAAFSVVGVMAIIMQEKHEHEDHYTVPPPSEQNNAQ